jgi:nitrogen regulatory protein PII
MKAILITFNQSYNEQVLGVLDRYNCRGYTTWEEVQGRGSRDGEPHLGSHAWPTLNSTVLAMVEDNRVEQVLGALHALDTATPKQGLRAFVWHIEQSI